MRSTMQRRFPFFRCGVAGCGNRQPVNADTLMDDPQMKRKLEKKRKEQLKQQREEREAEESLE